MNTDFRSDRVIVKLRPATSSSEITNLQAEIGVTKVTKAEQFGIDIWELPEGNVEETISAYENDPRFEYIEPDYIITLDDVEKTSPTQENLGTITPLITTPNDPAYPQLWGLNNTGQSGGTPDADIDAPEAWDIQTGNPNLVIGVIDSGVDYNHPDLVGNIWTNPGEIAGDGIDNDSNGYIDDVRGWDFGNNDNNPMDVDSHGTHVSGTIAGKGNNSVGVTGVAWNAKIMPLKMFSDSGYGSDSGAILALNYATAKGVKLTNNSWGGGGYSQALYDAINTAGQQGALFIAAAGNDYGNNNDINPVYPASYNLPNIISVAATTRTDALAIFSNFGPTSVDLGAPGEDIYSTTPGGNYALKSGTSMASPHVAGGAALVWSQNPTWTAQQVKNRLLQTTDFIPALSGKTVSGGRLNIKNALGGSSPNDNFSNRIYLGGLPVSTTGSNIGATGEAQEPAQSGPINSVWWSWTAPSTGTVNFDTLNSNFDTWLSVFTGSALNNLSLIGFNDDVTPGSNLTSRVSLNVSAGTTYQIAVDGYQSYTGNINLNITAPPPPNDNFANAIALTGATANSTGSNHGATPEVGEPAQSEQINSAWWSWTAPSNGFFKIDTIGSNFDTWLSVFTGPAVNNLSLIGFDDDGAPNRTSLYNLNATAGTTYRIAVDGYSNYTLGSINLNIAPTAPPNDNFANRIGLGGQTANATGSNIRATAEVGEPTQSGTTESVWWSWTAPSSGNYTFDTLNSNFDTWLSVFTGSALNSLSLIGFDDDGGPNNTSKLSRSVTAGTTYQIAVDGFGSYTGQIQLHIAPTPAGSAGAGNLTETANAADSIKDLADPSAGNTANNTLQGEAGEDILTGGTGADSLMLPFAESSVSAKDPLTDFGSEKIDSLTEAGAAMNAPSLFSPAANSTFPTLEKGVIPVFTEANGALAGNQALEINSDPLRVAKAGWMADIYPGIYDAKQLGI
jgi:subtilisin family serine protease